MLTPDLNFTYKCIKNVYTNNYVNSQLKPSLINVSKIYILTTMLTSDLNLHFSMYHNSIY